MISQPIQDLLSISRYSNIFEKHHVKIILIGGTSRLPKIQSRLSYNYNVKVLAQIDPVLIKSYCSCSSFLGKLEDETPLDY